MTTSNDLAMLPELLYFRPDPKHPSVGPKPLDAGEVVALFRELLERIEALEKFKDDARPCPGRKDCRD